jgi:hypothetical protein
MKWHSRTRIEAPVAVVEEQLFAPKMWMTYFRAYRGLAWVDRNWPEQGSSIITRYSVLGPIQVAVKHTIVEREHGHRVRLREEALSGVWIDNVEWLLGTEDNATDLTITTDQTSNFLPVRPLIMALWPLNYLVSLRAIRRLKAVIEAELTATAA